MIFKTFLNLRNSEDFKRLASNFSFLFLLNISNFIFPLLTFPFLINRLGIDGFGLINFANSFIVYFTLITEYGFNLTATRDISMQRDNQSTINDIFSKVIYSKVLLSIISFFTFSIIVFYIPQLKIHGTLFLLTFLSIFGQIFIPIWFFQGIEKMKVVSILFFISKLLSTISIFLLIEKSSDILLVPIINFASFVLISIISMVICLKTYNIRFKIVTLRSIIKYGQDGFHIFISNISVSFFSTGTITILGLLTNNYIVGYFSAADKIIQAIRTLMNTLSQILFPFLSKLSVSTPTKVYEINGKLLKFGGILFLLFTIFLIVYSDFLLRYLTNTENTDATLVMRILSLVPIISFVHIVLAMFTLLVFKKNKDYSLITLVSGIINLLLSLILIYYFTAIGAAISIVVVEIFAAFLYIRAIKKNNLKIFL